MAFALPITLRPQTCSTSDPSLLFSGHGAAVLAGHNRIFFGQSPTRKWRIPALVAPSSMPMRVEASFAWDESENIQREEETDGITFEQQLLAEQLRRAFIHMSDTELKSQVLDIVRLQAQEANIWSRMLRQDFGFGNDSGAGAVPSEEMVDADEDVSLSTGMGVDQSFKALRLQQLMDGMTREEIEQTWTQVYTDYCIAKNTWKRNLSRLSRGATL
eukprot:tig00000319_g24131.t1